MKLIFVFLLTILIPLIPFLILGESFEKRLMEYAQADWPVSSQFAIVASFLAIDIFLPVPSSAITTYAGASLGVPLASLASFLGMTTGGLVGFGLARLFGEPILHKLTSPKERESITRFNQEYGLWAIPITRGLPLLAEPCVFLLGATNMKTRRFLIPFLLSNLAVSLVYTSFGAWFGAEEYLGAAIVASIAIPVGLTVIAKRYLIDQQTTVPRETA